MYRLLIVEDEDWIRRGIVECIDWLALDMELAGEAENGERALNILDNQPVDIIITDMKMPVCDGRGLLQGIEEKKYDCEVIVLSEYTDFEYTRQAIHAHVAEYLLKPIDPQQLNDILLTVIKRLAEKRLLHTSDRGPYDAVFRTAIARTSQAQLEAICRSYQEEFKNKCVVVSSIQPGTHLLDVPPEILNTLVNDAPYLTYTFPYHDNRNVNCLFTVAPYPYTAGARFKYNSWLRSFFERFKEEWGRDTRIGTGKEIKEISHIRDGLTSALAALQFLHYGHGGIVYYGSVDCYKAAPGEILINEQQILELLLHSKKDEVPKLKKAIIDALCKPEYIYLPTLRQILIDLTHALERCSSKTGYGLNITSIMGESYIDKIARIDWLSEADAFLGEVFDIVFQNIEDKRALTTADLIEEIIQHIETHYMDDINLMYFSQQYHINYVHLSRQFKERTGETFTDFLLRIRMTRARELIECKGFDEKGASVLVGYSNPYYFVTSYRKYYHLNNKKENADGA